MTMTNPLQNRSENETPAKSALQLNIALTIGVVTILVFFGQTFFMFFGVRQASETEWSRAVYLLSGVETVAFAAVAFFFGREIHRERAEKAEERAVIANKETITHAQRATTATTSGQILRNHIAQMVQQGHQGAGPFATLGGSGAAELQARLENLAELSRELFP